MGKRVLIVSGSPRKRGNSDLLCYEFEKGAVSAGNSVKKIFIQEKNIKFCTGCYSCVSNHGKCIHKDDVAEIIQDMTNADVIVMSTPVYFYSVSGQLKTLIDRTVARYTEIKNKEFYIIAAAAENSYSTFTRTVECIRGFIDCISGAKEKGVLTAGGVWKKGEIYSTKYIQQAYDMGAAV